MNRRSFTKSLTLSAAAVLLLAVPGAAQIQQPLPWTIYTVKGEQLSIALPRLPGVETSTETRTRPQKDRQKLVIRCSSKGVVYVVNIVENPKPRLSLESFIQEQQATANPGENLTADGDVDLDGIKGKTFTYADGKGMVRFFARDDRLYEIRAYGAAADDPRIVTFFHYLTLTKQENAIEISENVQAGLLNSTETLYIGKDVDTKARLIRKPDPVYTEKARSAQISGSVVLKCVFAADGTVKNIWVVSGLPFGLTERAIESARKIKFIPATKDGKNVSMWMELVYNFNLY